MSADKTARRPKAIFVGLATVDISYTVDKIPRRNQKISVESQRVSAGGPSANAAATFAFLGGRTKLITAIGSHPLASVMRRDLMRRGVQVRDLARSSDEPPPVSSIMVLRGIGERTVVSANANVLSVKTSFNSQWLDGVSVMQVDGHYMSLCIAAARGARRRGISVVLDSGSWKKRMAELLRFVDIAICSEDFRPPGCRSTNDVFQFLLTRGIRKIAISRGDRSIQFVDGDGRGEVKVRKVRAVDTLGAGDILHGAFCYYACQAGNGLRDALAAAARVATFSCRFSGTRSWMEK
jgi:sugar/nucleoside kinase (ribokinase family)